MEFKWTTPLSRRLAVGPDEALSRLYHESSKLFPESARTQVADVAATPFQLYVASRGFRQYRSSPKVPLPGAIDSEKPLRSAMLERRSRRELSGPVELAELATILTQSLGPTAVVENLDLELMQVFRSAPSAGGLYPLDTYVIAARVEGLDPGVYHFNVITAELELLPRTRPPESVLRDGFFWQPFVTTAAAAVLLVASFERTMAKYGERGYRLVLLDAGHAGQNVLLSAEQVGLHATAVAGFHDDQLARDLGIDGVTEAVVHSVVIGRPDE